MSAQEACRLADLAVGTATRVQLEGTEGPVDVAVVRTVDGAVHAVSDMCTHGKVSLSDGEVEGETIECWLHGSAFDLRTGVPTSLPATAPVTVYPVIVDGEHVLVDLT